MQNSNDIHLDVERFLREGYNEVQKAMQEAGEAAVEYNIENGDYHDRTGHLRSSNYYEVDEDKLVVGNRADYATDVESRGYMVCSGGALLAESILK